MKLNKKELNSLQPKLQIDAVEHTKSKLRVNLTPHQQKHLEELIVRYTKRTQTSKQLMQTYHPVLADNRGSLGLYFSINDFPLK